MNQKSLDKKKPIFDIIDDIREEKKKMLDNNKTKELDHIAGVGKKVGKPKELDFNDKLYDIWFESLCNGNYQMFQKKVKEMFTQQRTELLDEIKTRIDTWGGFEDDGGNLCHYDSEILEWVKNLLNKKDE